MGKNDGNITTQRQLINSWAPDRWTPPCSWNVDPMQYGYNPPAHLVQTPGSNVAIKTWRVKLRISGLQPFRKEPCLHWPHGIHPIDSDPADKWCRQSSASERHHQKRWPNVKRTEEKDWLNLKTSRKSKVLVQDCLTNAEVQNRAN